MSFNGFIGHPLFIDFSLGNWNLQVHNNNFLIISNSLLNSGVRRLSNEPGFTVSILNNVGYSEPSRRPILTTYKTDTVGITIIYYYIKSE
jgi:hypothetical protein